MRDLTPQGRLNKLVVRGARLQRDVATMVLSSTITLTTTGITTFDLTFADPRLELLGSRLLAEGAAVDYLDLRSVVRSVSVDPDPSGTQVSVVARSVGVRKMRADKGSRVWKGASPTEVVRRVARAAGLKVVAQPTASRRQVARGKKESSWGMANRLAGELGFICFESAGTLFFGKPTWLLARDNARVRTIAWDAAKGIGPAHLLAAPQCRRSEDAKKHAAEITLQLKGGDAEEWRPGDVLRLTGVPTFAGRYLVTSVTIPLNDTAAVTVTAATPENPAKQKASGSGSTSGGSSGGGASGQVERFVQHCLDQAGDAYVFGAEASKSDSNPDAFDCSELVEWACSRVGVFIPDGSSAQREFCRARGRLVSIDQATKTRGALLFANGHVAVSLGDGRTIEARGRAYGVGKFSATQGRAWIAGGLIPSMTYPRRS